MNRELTIHIGLPKTGSTAAQTFFARNREALLTQSIDYLPIGEFREGAIGKIASGNGAYLARSMLPKGDPAYLQWDQPRVGEAFIRAIQESESSRLLLSSEMFALPEVGAWSEFVALCEREGIGLRFIAAVRNHFDWLTSAYLQGVKRHQVTEEPGVFIRRLYKSTRHLKYATYFSALSTLCEERIEFISYDQGTANGRLLDLFQRALGLGEDVPLVGKEAKANVTPSPEEIAFIRQCNAFKPRMNFSDVLAARADEQVIAPWSVINSELQLEITDYFSIEVASFIERFHLDPHFFEPSRSRFVDLDAVTVTSERWIGLLGRYLVSFDSAIESLRLKVDAIERATGTDG